MSEKEIARRRQAEKLAYTFYRIRYPYFLKKLHQQFCLHCHGILCKHIETGEEFYTLFSSSFSAFTSDFVSDLLSCCEEQAVNDSKSAAAKTIAKNFFIFNSFFL